jgi:diamine N-acetyltransferase
VCPLSGPINDSVGLREISDANRDAVLALEVKAEQQRYVGSVADALEDALAIPEGKAWSRAIYLADEPVGFVMMSWNVIPDPPRIIGPWFLWKLLIDQSRQGQGIGRTTVRLIADMVRAEGAVQLLTSYVEGEGDPGGFYRRLGFIPTGERDDHGEAILVLHLA